MSRISRITAAPISVSADREQRDHAVGDELVERLDVVGQPRDHARPSCCASRSRSTAAAGGVKICSRRSWSTRCADPLDEVGLRPGRAPVDDRAEPGTATTITSSAPMSLVLMPGVDRLAGEVRRRQRGRGASEQRRRTSATTRARYGRSSSSRPRSLRARWSSCAADQPPQRCRAAALTARPPPSARRGLRVEEDLVGQALLRDLAVEVGLLEQLLVACRARRCARPRAPRSRRPARSSTAGGR